MKKTITLLSLISTLASGAALGQAKYYKNDKGEVLDAPTYQKMKDDKFNKVKSIIADNSKKIEVEEELEEISKNADSVVYLYNLKYKVSDSKSTAPQTDNLSTLVNKEFPLPTLTTLDGKNLTINDLKGKPTLINFWFAACKPCVEEMPILNKLKADFGEQVNFVSVTFETAEKVKNFLLQHPFDFTHVPSAMNLLSSTGIRVFPVNMFLDKEGVVRRVTNGIPFRRDANGDMKIGDGKEFAGHLNKLLK